MVHEKLKHNVVFALRWVINDFTQMGDPDLFYSAYDLVNHIEETLGESDVNDDILYWATTAKIGDTWKEDDLIITRI